MMVPMQKQIVIYLTIYFITSVLISYGVAFLNPIEEHLRTYIFIETILLILAGTIALISNRILKHSSIIGYINDVKNSRERNKIKKEFQSIYDSGKQMELNTALIETAINKIKSNDVDKRGVGLLELVQLGKKNPLSDTTKKQIFMGLLDCLRSEMDSSSVINTTKTLCLFFNRYELEKNPQIISEKESTKVNK
jgi:hypothetical protein